MEKYQTKWRTMVQMWQNLPHRGYLRYGILCLLIAFTFMLVPETYETVDLTPRTVDGVTAYPIYEPEKWDSIQQITLDLTWRYRDRRAAANDILFSLPNAWVMIQPQLLEKFELPARSAQSYRFSLRLYDDAVIVRAAAGGADDLPLVLYQVAHHMFIKTDMAQSLLINDRLIQVEELRITRVIDPLLPKIAGALLAAAGVGLLLIFTVKRCAVAPSELFREKLWGLLAVLTGGLAAALAMCVYYRSQGMVDYPYGSFLFVAADRFNDLFNTFDVMRFVSDPYSAPRPGSEYFPFTYLVLKLVPSFNCRYVIYFSYTLFLGFYLVSAFAVCCRRGYLAIAGLLAILLLNYPLWYLLDRGNIDFLVYIFIFLFVWCYRQKYDWPAVLFLIGAVNLKLYPAILAVLYLKDRQYRKFFAAAFGSLALFGLSLWSLGGNWRGFFANLQRFQERYVFSLDGINCSHSLFGWFKLWAHELGNVDQFAGYTFGYTVLALILAALVSIYVIWVEKVFWKNLYLLLAMMLLLPHTSFDYRMIVLVIPMLYFLADDQAERHWLWYALTWGVLLMPIHWIFDFGSDQRQLSTMVRAPLLTAMALFIMLDGRRGCKTQSAVTISSSKIKTGRLS